MNLRWAKPEDIKRMTDIFNYEVLNATSSFCIKEQTIEERTAWFHAHNQSNRPLIVAEEDGQAVGFACLSDYRAYEAYRATVELSVYVDHNYRRRGIARALMTEILRLAKENGEIHAIISVITGDNQKSIELHEQFGFQYGGISHEVGYKFGRYLDVVYYEYLFK